MPDTKSARLLSWSGDWGLEMYEVWCLDSSEISTVTLWSKWEEYCDAQANELKSRYDIVRSFIPAGLSIDGWYNQIQKQ